MIFSAVTTRFLSFHLLLGSLLFTASPMTSAATPEFSRKYNMSCTHCYTSATDVTAFAHSFIDANDRMAGKWFDRATIFDYRLGMADVALGPVRGRNFTSNLTINSSGYSRSDDLFDYDYNKAMFGRLGTDLGPINGGLFASGGLNRYLAATSANTENGKGHRDSDRPKSIFGVDFNGTIGSNAYWYAQAIWNEWDAFIDLGNNYRWLGGYAGIDYVHSPSWTYSLLYHYTDTQALASADRDNEAIDIKTLTFTASHHFMFNIKGVIEYNLDLQNSSAKKDSDLNGKLTNENYLLFGLDAEF